MRPATTPAVGQAAPDVVLAKAGGGRLALSDAWSTGPALLVFLRHLG